MQDKKFNNYEHTSRSVRYLNPNSDDMLVLKPQPLKSIVFIQYNPAVSCNFKQLPQNEAFKLFHEQAWVSNDPKHVRSFINWFLKLPCYRLEYGNTNAGMNKILQIFGT